jgi:lipoprotein-anchoring transpeptidase ErfK/SrfK
MKMRFLLAAALSVVIAGTTLAPQSFAAKSPEDGKALVLKKKKADEAKKLSATKKQVQTAKKLTDELTKLKAAKAKKEEQLVTRDKCKGFMQCLFGSKRVRVTREPGRTQVASLAGAGLSGKVSRKKVEWSETKYPVGSLIVRTPERALYFVSGNGEAIRYSVGVGKEGMQWSGSSRIDRKAEWPSWTPPATMIKREAAKGHIIPPFMEGGPGNPLGARALYIGGKIYRVHGTNNEASIGGAVSSGCIRMMNADVIDLYDRVKIGAKIYVYQ